MWLFIIDQNACDTSGIFRDVNTELRSLHYWLLLFARVCACVYVYISMCVHVYIGMCVRVYIGMCPCVVVCVYVYSRFLSEL